MVGFHLNMNWACAFRPHFGFNFILVEGEPLDVDVVLLDLLKYYNLTTQQCLGKLLGDWIVF